MRESTFRRVATVLLAVVVLVSMVPFSPAASAYTGSKVVSGSVHTTDSDFNSASTLDNISVGGGEISLATEIPTGGVARYQFEQSLGDEWGTNGLSEYGPSEGYVSGIQGDYAKDFNKVDGGYLTGAPRPDTSVGTVQFWLNPDDAAGTSNDIYFGVVDSNGDEFSMRNYDSGTPYFGWNIGGTDYRLTPTDAYTGGTSGYTLVTLTWNYTAGTTTVYYNGTEIATGTLGADPAGVLDRSPYVGAGNNDGTLDAEMAGSIDDLQIYNRDLSQSEIQEYVSNPDKETKKLPATYVSANHSIENSQGGYVDITALNDASATVTWETWDGTKWVQQAQATYTTAGNRTLTWAETTDTKARVTVDVTATGSNPTFTAASEGVVFENDAPTASNFSPTNGSSTGGNFEADVSDPQFGTVQGETLTAEWYVDGSLVATQTVSSAGRISYTNAPAGTHTYQLKLSDEYGGTFASDVRTYSAVLSEGARPIADSPQFDVNPDGTIAEKHDLLNDTDNYRQIVDADVSQVDESAGEWSSAGAGAIYNHTDDTGDNKWYLSLRQRTPSDGTADARGKSFELWMNTGELRDKSSWGKVWEVYMKDKVQSIEGSMIREYEGTWYFYFSYDDPTSSDKVDWVTAYVTADTPAGLEAKLNDTSTWVDLTDSGVAGTDGSDSFQTDGDGTRFEKDPYVMTWNGSYYMMTGQVGGDQEDQYLYRADTPNFSNPTYLSNPAAPVQQKRSATNTINVGTISYDVETGKFIWWSNQFNHSAGKNDWVWATSDDLQSWQYADARHVGELTTGFSAPRYPDYALAGVEGGAGVFMLEWDPDKDGVSQLYLWDYAPSLDTLTPTYQVDGTVTDSGGNPVEGVTVTASKNGTTLNQTTTDAQGYYELTVDENTNVTLTADKSGYTAETKETDVTQDKTVNFVLGSVSLTGTVTDSETGAAIEGADVTVTRDSDGAVIATTTTNSSGGYTVGVVDGTTYTVEVGASGYGAAAKTVTTSGTTTVLDFQLNPNAVPFLDSASPTSGEYVDTRTVTLNATVTDPEGTDVTVQFYMLNASGTYTLRGSDTVPSGGTAEITGVQAEPGQNAWYVKMTDGDGNSDTSPAFLFNTPGSVEIYDATTATNPENYSYTPKTVTAQISSFESSYAAERTVTDGTLDLTNLPNERLVITFTASNRTTQRLIVDDTAKQYQVLLYDTANTYTQGFTLDDKTGDFAPSSSHVVIKQRYGGSWQIVASDAFGGINLAQLALKDGVDYRIEVYNDQGDMRQLGGFTGDSANAGTTTELTISDPTGDVEIERGARYEWAAYARNSSGTYSLNLDVTLLVSDTTEVSQFDNVTVKMWEYGNRKNEIYNSSLGVQQNFTITNVINESQYVNKTWVISWNATLGAEKVGGTRVVGSQQMPTNIPLSDTYKGVAGVIMLLFTGTLFTRANAAFGAFITALVTALLWYIGFMPPAISGSIVVLTLALGVVFVILEKESAPA